MGQTTHCIECGGQYQICLVKCVFWTKSKKISQCRVCGHLELITQLEIIEKGEKNGTR